MPWNLKTFSVLWHYYRLKVNVRTKYFRNTILINIFLVPAKFVRFEFEILSFFTPKMSKSKDTSCNVLLLHRKYVNVAYFWETLKYEYEIKNYIIFFVIQAVRAMVNEACGPLDDLLAIVKQRKLKWYGHVTRSSGLAKTILQGTVRRSRKRGRQKKRWEDNIREWTGLDFATSQRAAANRSSWRKLAKLSSKVPLRPNSYGIKTKTNKKINKK